MPARGHRQPRRPAPVHFQLHRAEVPRRTAGSFVLRDLSFALLLGLDVGRGGRAAGRSRHGLHQDRAGTHPRHLPHRKAPRTDIGTSTLRTSLTKRAIFPTNGRTLMEQRRLTPVTERRRGPPLPHPQAHAAGGRGEAARHPHPPPEHRAAGHPHAAAGDRRVQELRRRGPGLQPLAGHPVPAGVHRRLPRAATVTPSSRATSRSPSAGARRSSSPCPPSATPGTRSSCASRSTPTTSPSPR